MIHDATLVVVDMQPIFGHPDSPWYTPGFADIVPQIASLAREYERVVLTRFTLAETPLGSWESYYHTWSAVREERFLDFYRVIPELADLDPDPIALPTFSKWGPDLELRLEGALHLVGVSTECCVLATALGAIDAGANVLLIEDLCAAVSDAAHRATVLLLSGFAPQAAVVHSSSLVGR